MPLFFLPKLFLPKLFTSLRNCKIAPKSLSFERYFAGLGGLFWRSLGYLGPLNGHLADILSLWKAILRSLGAILRSLGAILRGRGFQRAKNLVKNQSKSTSGAPRLHLVDRRWLSCADVPRFSSQNRGTEGGGQPVRPGKAG